MTKNCSPRLVWLYLWGHDGTGLIQNLLSCGQLLCLRGLWQEAGLGLGHLVYIEAGVPAGQLVIRDCNWGFQRGQEHLRYTQQKVRLIKLDLFSLASEMVRLTQMAMTSNSTLLFIERKAIAFVIIINFR